DHDHDHDHHHHHHHSDHLANDGFVSIAFESDRPFDVKKFEQFLTEKMPTGVFRAKGILWFSESEIPYIFQLSGPRYDIQLGETLRKSKNQVVFIGRHLNSEEIKQQLNSCLV
ncbi:MAG: GTP-binding protein, partial [Arthrospira sp. PLM2.Bin9]